jgi:hypothetical protein
MLIALARRTGVAAYVGAGANRWPDVHLHAAASVYLLALEKAALGTRLHAVGEKGVPMRVIAETFGWSPTQTGLLEDIRERGTWGD